MKAWMIVYKGKIATKDKETEQLEIYETEESAMMALDSSETECCEKEYSVVSVIIERDKRGD